MYVNSFESIGQILNMSNVIVHNFKKNKCQENILPDKFGKICIYRYFYSK